MEKKMKLNLGAGKDIRPGYLNHDIADLSGIHSVHNLDEYPWPWDDQSFSEVVAIDVLEHLDNFVRSVEEIHRILKPKGSVMIRVPYWNSWCAYADPTHKRGFHEITFQFFDYRSPYYIQRDYYTKACFKIIDEAFVLSPGEPYFHIPKVGLIYIRNKLLKKIIGYFGNHFGNIIHDIHIVMQKSDKK